MTQTALIDYLLEASQEQQKSKGGNIIQHGLTSLAQTPANGGGPAAKTGPKGGSSGVYTALAQHLQRIAGNQVSNSGLHVLQALLCAAYCQLLSGDNLVWRLRRAAQLWSAHSAYLCWLL